MLAYRVFPVFCEVHYPSSPWKSTCPQKRDHFKTGNFHLRTIDLNFLCKTWDQHPACWTPTGAIATCSKCVSIQPSNSSRRRGKQWPLAGNQWPRRYPRCRTIRGHLHHWKAFEAAEGSSLAWRSGAVVRSCSFRIQGRRTQAARLSRAGCCRGGCYRLDLSEVLTFLVFVWFLKPWTCKGFSGVPIVADTLPWGNLTGRENPHLQQKIQFQVGPCFSQLCLPWIQK